MQSRWILSMLFPAVLFPGLAVAAQAATPQWRTPAVDSTHVTGNAVKVMPEYVPPVAGSTDTSAPEAQNRPPSSIAELLQAFAGIVLEVPGNAQRGAHGQLRVVIHTSQASLQQATSRVWHETQCVTTASHASCGFDNYRLMLSPEGVFLAQVGCPVGYYGTSGGGVEFKWADFSGAGGKAGGGGAWLFQRDTLWSSCRSDVGSND